MTHIFAYIHLHRQACICMSCTQLLAYTHTRVCVFAYIHLHRQACIRMPFTHLLACTHTHIRWHAAWLCMHRAYGRREHTHLFTFVLTHTHTRMHTRKYIHTHTHAHTCTLAHTHTHTHTHTHKHTHTRTRVYVLRPVGVRWTCPSTSFPPCSSYKTLRGTKASRCVESAV